MEKTVAQKLGALKNLQSIDSQLDEIQILKGELPMEVQDLEDDLEFRIKHWEKLQALKSILIDDYLTDAVFEEEYLLENHKEISRIYAPLDQKVSIHNKNSWRDVMEFFNEKMSLFEAFFEEYKDVIEG